MASLENESQGGEDGEGKVILRQLNIVVAVVVAMNWLGSFYQWFWFHTEFWLTPVDRRPYTFIMRDWIYTHVSWFVLMVVVWYASMIVLSIWHGTTATVTVAIGSFLLAHLVWGSKYIEAQQEYPEYLDA